MGSIANRKEEFRLFHGLLKAECDSRILLLEGPSERGKSILLAELASKAEAALGQGCCARADFKGGLTLDDLFSRLCGELGAKTFPTYAEIASGGKLNVTIETDLSGARFGDENKVAVQPVIQTGIAESVHIRGDALMQDLRSCENIIVIIVDTFEAATEQASKWIVQQLLPVARQNSALRIVLAGQNLPRPKHYPLTWGVHATFCTLEPVTSVDDWHEYALTHHPKFPRQHIETVCMGGLTDRPSIIQEFIETIARKLPRPNIEVSR